jgi:hypothetical protein
MTKPTITRAELLRRAEETAAAQGVEVTDRPGPIPDGAGLSPSASVRTLKEVVAIFSRWLHLEDPGPLLAILGSLAANLLPGDPVWLLVVGPPGSGKTEMLQACARVPRTHLAGTMTEGALLSGSPKREQAKDATGGLLRKVGDHGIIICKDLGSILSMHREARGQVLAALRECYDGSWTRLLGTDGGRTLSWSGKLGLLAGSTPVIDRHHAAMASLGERFTTYRLEATDDEALTRRALEHTGAEPQMREELAASVAGLFAGLDLREVEHRTEEENTRLIRLSALVVRARSAVERDSYTRDIELVPASEAPTRLAVTLERLRAGLRVIGVSRAEAWRIVTKAALDSIPEPRRQVLDLLADGEERRTAEVADDLDLPTQTARRALEDLQVHKVLAKERHSGNQGDAWMVTPWAAERYESP